MLQVLEFKGFITTAENGSGYVLTNKLFALAMAQAPVRSLVETALPIMRKLVQDIGQSAHIAVASEDQIVVITRIERPGDLGFSVRIGYRREIASATSGLVLFAYQNEEIRRIWLKRCRLKGEAAESFVERANVVRTRGYHEAASHFVRGIVDLSAPILRDDTAVAALTIPFVHSNPLQVEMAAGRGVRARSGETDIQRNRSRRPSMTEREPSRRSSHRDISSRRFSSSASSSCGASRTASTTC